MPVNVGQIVISLGANTQAFSIEMDRAAQVAAKSTGQIQGSLQKLSGGAFRPVSEGAEQMGKKIKEAGEHGVTGVQATSAALRTLEGGITNNLRAAERFLATTLGLGPALKNLFPVAGALALGGVLFELVEKAVKLYDALKQLQEAPARIASEFGKINSALVTANDELAVANDKVANEIARLSGKPENGLKLALDEARVAADRLGEALQKNLDEVQKLLTQESVSGLKSFFTGKASTKGIETQIFGEDGYGGFKAKIADITDKYQALLASTTTGTDAASIRAKERNDLEAQYGKIIADVTKQLKDRQDLQAKREFLQAHPQLGDLTGQTRSNLEDTPQDQGIAIAILKGLRRNLLSEANSVNLQTTSADQNAVLAQKKTAGYAYTTTPDADPFGKTIARDRAELAGLRIELEAVQSSTFGGVIAKGAAEAGKQISALTEELKASGKKLSPDQQGQIFQAQFQIEAAKNLNAERKKGEELESQMSKAFDEQIDKERELARTQAQKIADIRQETSETQRLAAAQLGGLDAVRAAQLANVDSRVKVGQIDQDEADAIKAKMTAEEQLKDVESAIKSTRENSLATLERQRLVLIQIGASEQDLRKNSQEIQKVQTQLVLATGSWSDGIKAAFRAMSTGAQSSAQDAFNFFQSTFQSINSSLTALIEGQKVTWAGFFRGIASELAKIGLNKLESTIGGIILGKGNGGSNDPSKPSGTQANPIYTHVLNMGSGSGTGGGIGTVTDDGTSGDGSDAAAGGGSRIGSFIGGIASKLGGFFSSIFGKLFGAIGGAARSFGGFFANGGDIAGNQAYVVGEQGPELFVPRGSGAIVPNRALGGGASYYIDARGADEAAVDRRVRASLVAVHGSAVRTSAAVAADAAKRRP